MGWTGDVYAQTETKGTALFLSPRAVGIVYLVRADSGGYLIDVTFPAEMLTRDGGKINEHFLSEKDSVKVAGEMLLIDSQGVVATLVNATSSVGLHEWCENDGGLHVRPTLRLAVKNSQCSRPLGAGQAVDSIAGFVVFRLARFGSISAFRSQEATDGTVYRNVLRMEGSLQVGGLPIARIFEQAYEGMAGCGNNLDQSDLVLETCEGRFQLRCCGPGPGSRNVSRSFAIIGPAGRNIAIMPA